jgi:hypothetical protein
MRLTSTGLGIGTSSPSSKLDVVGTLTSTGTTSSAYFSSGNPVQGANNPTFSMKVANSNGGFLNWYNSSGTPTWGWYSYMGASGQQGNLSVRDWVGAVNVLDITPAGNVGIGSGGTTSTANQRLLVYGSNEGGTLNGIYVHNDSYSAGSARIALSPRYSFAYNTSPYIQSVSESTTAAALTFGTTTGGTVSERARIDSSGNFAVGTTTPTVYGGSAFVKTVNYGSLNNISAGFSDAVTGTFRIAHATNQNILNFDTAALCFQSGGISSPTERARIDSSGNLLVGTTSGSNRVTIVGSDQVGGRISVTSSANYDVLQLQTPASNTQNSFLSFFNANNTAIGSVTTSNGTSGSTVLYNVTSDQRLKENIQDADSASSLIDALQVRKFDWKSDSSHQRYGFVAQELVTVAPEAVHQPTDTEEMMAVDYSKLVPMLVKEIQSLRQRLSAANL